MRVAILSVSNRSTLPPHKYGYGGMTRVNWWLAEALATMGLHVTFFGAPGTVPPAGVKLIEYPASVVRPNTQCAGKKKATDMALAAWFEGDWLDKFDVIHSMSHRHPVALFLDGPILATMQNPNKRKRWEKETRNLVAVSPAHAKKYGGVPWVFNCARMWSVTYRDYKEPFLFLMGVMQSYKGVLETVEAAIKADMPLVLAGTRMKSPYGQQVRAAMKGHPDIKWVGEVQGERKDCLLSTATAAMLFVKWLEPGTMFGVEAMAAGTPIIGSFNGCIPDYVVNGKTGFLCRDVDEMVRAILRIGTIQPWDCHQRYLRHFTAKKAAERYLALYQRTIAGETW